MSVISGEIFSIMNYLKTSDFYQPEVSTNPRVFYKQPKADLPEDAQGHANVEGLTETGKWMIHQMINRHMIIELDHMSDKSLNDTLISYGKKNIRELYVLIQEFWICLIQKMRHGNNWIFHV